MTPVKIGIDPVIGMEDSFILSGLRATHQLPPGSWYYITASGSEFGDCPTLGAYWLSAKDLKLGGLEARMG